MKKVLVGLFCMTTGVLANDSQTLSQQWDISPQQVVMTMMVLQPALQPVEDVSSTLPTNKKNNSRSKEATKVPYRKTSKDKSRGQSHSRYTGR